MRRQVVLLWLLALIVLFVDLFPIYIIGKQAVTPERESYQWPPTYVPQQLTGRYFSSFLKTRELQGSFFLSVLVASGAMLLALVLGLPAGWASVRFPLIGQTVLTICILSRLFPALSVGIPLTVIFIGLGFYNHPFGIGLILAHTTITLPYVMLIGYSAFKAVPIELEEQAQVDGASLGRTLWTVTFPTALPGIMAAALLAFIMSWDEFAYSLLLQVTNRNLPPLIYYHSVYGNVGVASALSFIMIVPAIIIALATQRYIKGGYLSGALK